MTLLSRGGGLAWGARFTSRLSGSLGEGVEAGTPEHSAFTRRERLRHATLSLARTLTMPYPLSKIGCKLVLAAAGVALALGAVAHAAPPVEPWFETRTQHFVVTGNASHVVVHAVALRLERVLEVLSRLTRNLTLSPARPVRVLVFGDARSFARHARAPAGHARSSGLLVRTPGADYVLIEAAGRADVAEIAAHELVHEAVALSFPAAPLWLNEGLAELFTNVWTDRYRVELGRPRAEHLAVLARAPLLPAEVLFAIEPDSPSYGEEPRKALFHAQSWLLAHYLVVGDAERRERFSRHLAGLGRPGADRAAVAREAFHTAFPETATLAATLDAYRRREPLPLLAIDLPEPLRSSVDPPRPIAPAEALFRLGEYLAHAAPDRPREAARTLRRALRLDPGHAGARAALERLERAPAR